MSATDFAARMEDFERYKVQQEAVEKVNQPSLVLVNPSPADKSPTDDVTAIHHPGVEGEDSTAEAKLRGEFFRTGDDMATFSVRKKRKMPPTIKNMMGEAHVRCARGDLTGAESICLEIIKERECAIYPTSLNPRQSTGKKGENISGVGTSFSLSTLHREKMRYPLRNDLVSVSIQQLLLNDCDPAPIT